MTHIQVLGPLRHSMSVPHIWNDDGAGDADRRRLFKPVAVCSVAAHANSRLRLKRISIERDGYGPAPIVSEPRPGHVPTLIVAARAMPAVSTHKMERILTRSSTYWEGEGDGGPAVPPPPLCYCDRSPQDSQLEFMLIQLGYFHKRSVSRTVTTFGIVCPCGTGVL
jgi:hypothetical protein